MLLGTLGLVMWDFEKWRSLFARDDRGAELAVQRITSRIDMTLWSWCGFLMLVIYFGSALARGGVYRPRGIELGEPAFYVMPAMLLLPIITYVIDRRRSLKSRAR
jgi:hypothetical protein